MSPSIRVAEIGLLSLLIMIVGCHEEDTEPKRFPDTAAGQWPVQFRDELEFGTISFYPEPDVSWKELVDLTAFEGFWPGMKGKDAERSIGEPDKYIEHRREKIWVYRRPDAEVVVAHREMGSFFGMWWRLDAYYDPPLKLSDLLHPSVVEGLPDNTPGEFTIVIMNNGNSPGALVRVEARRIKNVDWVNNHGSGGARDGVDGVPET